MGGELKEGLESLATARRSLSQNLDRSHALSTALARCGPRIDEIHRRLPPLKSIWAHHDALSSVSVHIDRAVGPAAAVLKVFDAVHALERSLISHSPRTDLPTYLSLLKRHQEAVKFLSDNCALAILWLDDVVRHINGNSAVVDFKFLVSLKSSLRLLKSNLLAPLDGGLLAEALNRLEFEFQRLLHDPANVIDKLVAILDAMIMNDRFECCVSVYIEVRWSILGTSLEALGLDYLDISVDDFDHVQSIEVFIDKWGKHLEFVVKHLLEAEYTLCREVFEHTGPPGVWTGCFGEIAAQSRILAFLRFGKTVTESKKDPIKLLKLLDIFNCLNKLRLDFNRIFGGKACVEIQNETRALIKRVIDGSCEIFCELLAQVELQRQTPPPSDGSVPILVSFMTSYCNTLLGEEYRPVLTQVLLIQLSWKKQKFQDVDSLLVDAILKIINTIELNLENWCKGYEDQTLSYLFMMNTHWHLLKHLKGTRLGEILGDPLLSEHEKHKDYYAACYLRDSWSKLPALLSEEGLKAFNESFDEMYLEQWNWVIPDKDLREKICRLIVEAIVPVYESYMQNYCILVEQDASASKYVKYTVQALDKKLGLLFQQRPQQKATSFRVRHSNGKVRDASNIY